MNNNSYEEFPNQTTVYCARCRLKPAIYSCSKCEPYVNFCIQCDNYVHSMNSKKNHKRNVLQSGETSTNANTNTFKTQNRESFGNDNNLDQGSKYDPYEPKFTDTVKSQIPNTLNVSKYLTKEREKDKHMYLNTSTNISSTVNLNPNMTSTFDRPNLGSPYRSGSPKSPYRTLDNNNDQNYRRTLANNFTTVDLLNNTNSNSNNEPIRGTQSKDYINEIKNLYEKEKNDLLYRNSTLQSSLDHTKHSLNERINALEFQLEESKKKNSLNSQLMEDEFNLQMKRVVNEKDLEIKNLIYKVEDIERSNTDLMSKLNESLKNNADLKSYYKNMINDLEYEYKIKDKEYIDLKQSFENKMNFYTSNFEEEKLKLIRNYEDNFEHMTRSHKESKDKLNSIIYQREEDLKNIMDKHRDEDIRYQAEINELRKEIKFRINESENLRQKHKSAINEIEILQRTIDKGKKEKNDILKEVKMLENANRKKKDENKELKENAEKLSGIVYGKFKNKSSSKNLLKKSP